MIFNVVDKRTYSFSIWVSGIIEPSWHDNDLNQVNAPRDHLKFSVKEYDMITVSSLMNIAQNIPGFVTVYMYDLEG